MKCYRCDCTYKESGCGCTDGITIVLGDCREILPEIGSVDLVLTDPPYGIGYQLSPCVVGKGNRRILRGGKGEVAGDNEPFDPTPLLEFPRLITWGANWYAHRLPVSGGWIVWDKTGGGRGPRNNFSDAERSRASHQEVSRLPATKQPKGEQRDCRGL